MLPNVDDWPTEQEEAAAEAREEAAAIRAAARRVCGECGVMGGHSNGCPAAPEEDDCEEGFA